MSAVLAIPPIVCEICGNPPKPGGRALHQDHDHRTGRQRGLLCFTCNRFILGKYATPAKLRAAADYLERYAAPTHCLYCGGKIPKNRVGQDTCSYCSDLPGKEVL